MKKIVLLSLLGVIGSTAGNSAVSTLVLAKSPKINNVKPKQTGINKQRRFSEYNPDKNKKQIENNNIENNDNTNKEKEDKIKKTSGPEFDMSGNITVYGSGKGHKNTYYDGKDSASGITTNLKSTGQSKKDLSGVGIGLEGEIHFNVKGNLESGTKYGAEIVIGAVKDDIGIDKAYVFIERNNFGTLQIGNLKGPDGVYGFGGQSIIGGTFGIDGHLLSIVDLATGAPVPGLSGFSNKASKIVYYTPVYSGFQFGIAFTPDTKQHGHNAWNRLSGDNKTGNNPGMFCKGDKDKESPSGRNNVCVGLKHEYKFNNDLSWKLSVAFVTENTQVINTTKYTESIESESTPEVSKIKLNNAKAIALSGTVKYKDLSIAGQIVWNGKSRLPQKSEFSKNNTNIILPAFMSDKNGNAGIAWNVGAKYDWRNDISTALVYHNASRKVTRNETARTHILSGTVDRSFKNLLFKSDKSELKVFAEIDLIKSKSTKYSCSLYNLSHESKDAIKETNDFVFTAGARVYF